MAYWAKLLTAVSASHTGTGLLRIAWENSGRRLTSMDPCNHMGDPDEAPGSWLQVSLALALEGIWTEDLSLQAFQVKIK